MKVILLGEVKGKGGEGDVVDVAAGFANNYLLPRRLAEKATPGNLKQLEMRKHNIEKRELARTTDANTLLEVLNGKQVIVPAKVGEEGQLFGSVTTAMIAEAVEAQLGVIIDRKRIERTAAIKTAGEHEVTVNLYREINAQLGLLVGDGTQAPAEEAPEAEPEPEVVEAEAEVEAEEAPAEDAE